jgi:hypothetical protein
MAAHHYASALAAPNDIAIGVLGRTLGAVFAVVQSASILVTGRPTRLDIQFWDFPFRVHATRRPHVFWRLADAAEQPILKSLVSKKPKTSNQPLPFRQARGPELAEGQGTAPRLESGRKDEL